MFKFFYLLRKTIKSFTEDWAILLTHLQKKSFFVLFCFVLQLLQEIHLFFIEFYGKPLNISLYGQNLFCLPFSCQFLFSYYCISLSLLTDCSKIFHTLVSLFSTHLNLLLKFSHSFFFFEQSLSI